MGYRIIIPIVVWQQICTVLTSVTRSAAAYRGNVQCCQSMMMMIDV